MSKSNDNEDWLKALYVIGVILLLTPALLGIPLLLIAMLTPRGFGIDSGAYAIGTCRRQV